MITSGQLQLGVIGAGTAVYNLAGGSLTIETAVDPITFGSGTAVGYFDFASPGGTLNLEGTWTFASLTALANADFRVGGVAATSGDLNFQAIDIGGTGFTQITVNTGSSPFGTWAGTGTLGLVTFDGDTNGDGVQDGLAFLLGVANPDDDATGNLPTVSEDGSGNLVMVFNCLPSESRGTAELRVAHSNTLASFTATVDQVPDADDADADNDVTFVVDTVVVAPLNKVTATIAAGAAAGGKLFGRLTGQE